MLIVSAVAAGRARGCRRPAGHARAQSHSAALDAYDSAARPVAIVFDPWRLAPPASVPPMVQFEATPGLRRAPQPLRVLLNMRLALPAGTYAIAMEPLPGQALSGTVGLQVGRAGPPQQTWTVEAPADAAWTQTFTLDLDANFVGLRADDRFEASVSTHPRHSRSASSIATGACTGRRFWRRRSLRGMPAYFHDTNADVEATGFWARGRVTTAITLAVDPASQPRGVRLQLAQRPGRRRRCASRRRDGPRGCRLTPGHAQSLLVPALEDQRLLPVEITPEGGFVPAEHGGAAADRRLLGCWVEVVP